MADNVERLEFDIYARDRGAKRTFDEVARGADKAGDSFGGLGKDATQLDKHISDTETHLRSLIEEFERTEDVTLFRQFKRDKSDLATLKAMRKEVEAIANKAEAIEQQAASAAGGGGGVGAALGALPSQLKGAAIVGIAAIAPFLIEPIGAMVGGAVLGGVGVGGVVGGIAAAAQDERVRDFGERLGSNFMGGFKSAGRIFISPLLDQFSTLQRAEDVFLADLAVGFAKVAPVIKVIADGIEGFAENLNLDEAFGDALPALRAIGRELPEIGAAIGDALHSIGDESDGATMGLIELLHIMEGIIRGTGSFIAAMSAVFEAEVKAGYGATLWADSWLEGVSKITQFLGPVGMVVDFYRDQVGRLNDEDRSLLESLGKAKDAGDDWRGSLADQARGAREAADAAKQYEDAVDSLFNKIIGLKDAQLRYNQDLLKLRAELKDGAKTLAINTEEGQKNQAVILAQIRDIKAIREEHIANNMSVARANQLYEQQMKQLIDLAVQMGFDRKEVEQFTGALNNVPDMVNLNIVAHGLSPSLNHAIQLDKYMDKLDGRVVTSRFVSEFADYRAGERELSRRAVGGPKMAGRAYLVGENGPEILDESGSGYIHTAAQTRAMLSGMSGGSAGPARPRAIEVEGRVTLDVTGAHDALAQAIANMFRVDPGFRATVKSYVVDA